VRRGLSRFVKEKGLLSSITSSGKEKKKGEAEFMPNTSMKGGKRGGTTEFVAALSPHLRGEGGKSKAISLFRMISNINCREGKGGKGGIRGKFILLWLA